jgi:hypothetical protein
MSEPIILEISAAEADLLDVALGFVVRELEKLQLSRQLTQEGFALENRRAVALRTHIAAERYRNAAGR